MTEAWELFKQLLNPESIIQYGGLALLLAVVFAETGLFFGFFLPGDSLLFTAGLLCGTGIFIVNPVVLLLCVSLAGIMGNLAGYYFGWKTGTALFRREDSIFFKKSYIQIADDYYKKQGGFALIVGRFLPIVRTFAPILAGVIKMDLRVFMLYNVIGCVLWVFSLILTGYYLGTTFPGISDYLKYIVIGLIILTTIPIYLSYKKRRDIVSAE